MFKTNSYAATREKRIPLSSNSTWKIFSELPTVFTCVFSCCVALSKDFTDIIRTLYVQRFRRAAYQFFLLSPLLIVIFLKSKNWQPSTSDTLLLGLFLFESSILIHPVINLGIVSFRCTCLVYFECDVCSADMFVVQLLRWPSHKNRNHVFLVSWRS